MGYLYVIEDEIKRVKIGISKNPHIRINQIQTGMGLKINKRFIFNAHEDYEELERHLHIRFEKYRTLGEWFKTDFKFVLGYIKYFYSLRGYKLTQKYSFDHGWTWDYNQETS